jgi:hypothetical protein
VVAPKPLAAEAPEPEREPNAAAAPLPGVRTELGRPLTGLAGAPPASEDGLAGELVGAELPPPKAAAAPVGAGLPEPKAGALVGAELLGP